MTRRTESAFLLAVCALAIAVKIALLLTSQSALDGDEAILGLMAIHVRNGVSHPVFFYGQSYDAGAGILAHVIGLLFRIGGISGLWLKTAGWAVWIGVTLAAAGILRRWIGWRAAGWGTALILWAPTSIEWAGKTRGGQMLAVLLTLLTLNLAMRRANGVLLGMCAAAAIWIHPTALPAVAAALIWVFADSSPPARHREFYARALLVAAGALLASIIPLFALRTATTSWSWQAFTIGNPARDPVFLFGRVLPALFTPEVDWVVPSPHFWIKLIGYFWLGAFLVACAAFRKQHRMGTLLLAAASAAMLAMFMVDSRTVTARTLLPLYPLSCMLVAAAADSSSRKWTEWGLALLIASGMAVHAASFGPAMIHGAGEQARIFPASVVDNLVEDLDRHQVRCVFSESPMLQWNVMFASRERIAARWVAPRDRWQPYVDRVNAAFRAGEPCALIVRRPDAGYAVVFDPPRKAIEEVFAISNLR